MLKNNSFRAHDIHIHDDPLCIMPSALSRKRERKPNTELQKEKEDRDRYEGCILCHPAVKKQRNSTGSELEIKIPDKVATILNDFPYLPYQHRLYFLWNQGDSVKRHACHKYQIGDFGRAELYWLLRACKEDAAAFKSPPEMADRVRLIAGFNIGELAGQSLAHFHLQSGWEVVLNPREFTHQQLALYFNEIREEDLVIFETAHYSLIAPWTPAGKYAVDLYFTDKNEISELTDHDLRTFAVIGDTILRIYHKYLGITNVNIVLRGSPLDCSTEPLQFHFVPRVNLAAMYEILGVNVVDTFPQSIAAEFRRAHLDPNRVVLQPWPELFQSVKSFDPEHEFWKRVPESDNPQRHSVDESAEPRPSAAR